MSKMEPLVSPCHPYMLLLQTSPSLHMVLPFPQLPEPELWDSLTLLSPVGHCILLTLPSTYISNQFNISLYLTATVLVIPYLYNCRSPSHSAPFSPLSNPFPVPQHKCSFQNKSSSVTLLSKNLQCFFAVMVIYCLIKIQL